MFPLKNILIRDVNSHYTCDFERPVAKTLAVSFLDFMGFSQNLTKITV